MAAPKIVPLQKPAPKPEADHAAERHRWVGRAQGAAVGSLVTVALIWIALLIAERPLAQGVVLGGAIATDRAQHEQTMDLMREAP